MTIDLDVVEAAAKAATPGPWNIKHGYCLYDTRGMHVASACEVYDGSLGLYINSIEAIANAKFLEAANPTVVLEMIAELRKLRAELEYVGVLHAEAAAALRNKEIDIMLADNELMEFMQKQ